MRSAEIAAQGGFAFSCSAQAQVRQVLCDDLQVAPAQAAQAVQGEWLFTSLVEPESLSDAYLFLATVCRERHARGWKLTLRTAEGPRAFHLAGSLLGDDQMLIVGIVSASTLATLNQRSRRQGAERDESLVGHQRSSCLTLLERPPDHQNGTTPSQGELQGGEEVATSTPTAAGLYDLSVLRAFVDCCEEGIAITDENGRVVEWNPAQCRLTGLDRSSALGRSLADVLLQVIDVDRRSPDTHAAVEASVLRFLATGQATDVGMPTHPVWFRRGDGTQIALELVPFVISTDRGNAIGVVSHDVTERRQLEEDLWQSEATMGGVLAAMSDGVALVGLDGKILECNEAALRHFGGQVEEAIGTDLYDHIVPEDRERARSEAAVVLAEGFIRSEVRVMRKDGGIFDGETSVSPLVDGSGQPIGFVEVTRDITERKRAEAERERLLDQVQQQARELETVVQATNARLILLDRDLRIIRANAAFALAFGCTEAELLGRPIVDVFPGVQGPFEKVLETGEPAHALETPYDYPDQPWLGTSYYNWMVAPARRDENGEVSELVVSAVDVTSLVRARLNTEAFAARFKAAVENLSDGFASLIAVRDEAGQVVDFRFDYPNEATCQLVGYSRSDLLDRTLQEVLPPEVFVRVLDSLRSIVTTGEHCSLHGLSWESRYYDYQAAKLGDGVVVSWRDSTDHFRADEALRESEKLSRRYFDEAPVGANLVSLDNRFIRVNDELCRITGYSADELSSMTVGDITHPDDLEPDLAQGRRLLTGEVDHHLMDKRFIRRDGQVVWASLSAKLLRDEEGRPLYYMSMVKDITERKQAEDERDRLHKALEDSEAQYHGLFARMAAGCAIFEVVYDSDGQPYDYRYLAVNPAYEHITGTMGPDLIGRTLSETYSNQDPRWYEMKREALSSGGANRYLIHDQQRGRYVEGMIWAPRPGQLAQTYVDVTELELTRRERERLTTRLEQQTAMLEGAIDAMPGWVGIYGPDGTIVQANRALREYVQEQRPEGFSLPAEPYSGLLEARLPDGRHCAVEDLAFSRAMRGETVANQVVVLDRPSGGSITLSMSATPIRMPDAEQVGVVAITLDVSRLYEMELEREIFVRMVSHDLRNALAPLVTASHMLADPKRFSGVEMRSRLVQVIASSAATMASMIDELSDSVRLSSGHVKLALEPTDLARLVADVAGRAANDVEQNRVVVGACDQVPPVMADVMHIERVVVNLISNGLKYSGADDQVSVSVRLAGHGVVVSVADQGVGIAADELPRVFDRSYRATTSSSTEGLGLGLYISRLIVQAHDGGRIWAESRVGEGSTFCFALPLAS